MDAGLLDVLHDPAQIQVGAVEQRIDIDLDRVVQEPVDEDGMIRAHLGGSRDVRGEHLLVVDDLHAPPAEDVRRADQHRVADRIGHRLRVLE